MALWVSVCSRAPRTSAATAAIGIAAASSTVSTRVSALAAHRMDVARAIGTAPGRGSGPARTSARPRNGAASVTARTTIPLRASRYAVTRSAAAPAIVTSSNRTSDTRAATYTASAAGSGRSHPAGTVASRQNAPISNAVGRLIPACTGGA